MKSHWNRIILPIATLFACRMLGLFLLVPVLTLYAATLQAATPSTIGIALGMYGLSQGLLQIPFGLLSDRYGRKPIILLGLLLFALGSIIGVYSDSIVGVIVARSLQGMGAIGSVLLALLSDLTPVSLRTPAMAVIGVSIGLSFNLALVLSPPLAHHYGLSGIFMVTFFLACLGVLLIQYVIPKPEKISAPYQITLKNRLLFVLKNADLQRLNFGIFSQHAILTATFFVLPLKIKSALEAQILSSSWHFYLMTLVVAFLAAMPLIVFAEKRHKGSLVFVIATLLLAITQILLAITQLSWSSFCIVMFVYFLAFNALEAMLPSAVSKQTSPDYKGTAMGIYSSSQFLGIFAGGSMAGLIAQYHGHVGIFVMNSLLAASWFTITVVTSKY